MFKYFTKELSEHLYVRLTLWDVVLISEQYEGILKKEDQNKINNLIDFFDKNLVFVDSNLSIILSDLIRTLSSLLDSSNKEKSNELLKIVRKFDSII